MTALIVAIGVCGLFLAVQFIIWMRFNYCLKGIAFPKLGNSGFVTKKRLAIFYTLYSAIVCAVLSSFIILAW